jgi:Ca2+-binding RTX toxin-like protein
MGKIVTLTDTLNEVKDELYKSYQGGKATKEQYDNASQFLSYGITYDNVFKLDKDHYVIEIANRSYLLELSSDAEKHKFMYTEVGTKITYDIIYPATVGAVYDVQMLTLGFFKAVSDMFGADELAKVFNEEIIVKDNYSNLIMNTGKSLILERFLGDNIIDAKVIYGNENYLIRHRDAIDSLSNIDNKISYRILDGDNMYNYLKLDDKLLNFKLENNNIIVESLSSLVNYNLDDIAVLGLENYNEVLKMSANPDSIIVKNGESQKEYSIINQNQLWDISESSDGMVYRAVNDIAKSVNVDFSAQMALENLNQSVDKVIIKNGSTTKEYEIIDGNQLWDIDKNGSEVILRPVNAAAKAEGSVGAAIQFVEEYADFSSETGTSKLPSDITINNGSNVEYDIVKKSTLINKLENLVEYRIEQLKGGFNATSAEIRLGMSKLLSNNPFLMANNAIYEGTSYQILSDGWQNNDLNIPTELWTKNPKIIEDEWEGNENGSRYKDPETGIWYDSETGMPYDNETGFLLTEDGLLLDKDLGIYYDPDTMEQTNPDTYEQEPVTPENYKSLLDKLQNWFGSLIRRYDPIVVDLDNDGLEISSNENGVSFDMDQDGFAEKTSWVKPDDGLLVLDKNNNGVIDNIGELFGSPEKTGFEELRELDSNADGVLNASDEKFADIKVWQDKNQNGITDAGELTTLAQQGIESIQLEEASNGGMIEDAVLVSTGTVTKTDGSTLQTGEFNFAVDNGNTHYVGDDLTSDKTTFEALSYFELKGYGNVKPMYAALTEDFTLLELVKELVTLDLKDMSTFDSKIESMIYRWAGVEDIAKDSYTDNLEVDAQKKALIEVFTGAEIGSLRVDIPSTLERMYQEVHDHVKNQVLLQGVLANYFEDVEYNYMTDSTTVTGNMQEIIETLYQDLKDAPESLEFILNSLNKDFIGNVKVGGEGNEEFRVYGEKTTVFGFDGYDRLIGNSGDDTLYGGNGADQIWADSSTSYNANQTNYLYGEAGNDTIYGSAGADIINGGADNDTISGNGGLDTIIFDSNFGNDTLNSQQNMNIKFNINFADVDIIRGMLNSENKLRDTGNLYITEKSTGSIVNVKSLFLEPYYYGVPNEAKEKLGNNTTIEFADGVVLTWQDIMNNYADIQGSENSENIYGTDGSENIYGNGGNDNIYSSVSNSNDDRLGSSHILDGGQGDDYIKSFSGNDILIGGTGNDTLDAGAGDDILIGGAGNDTLKGGEGTNTYKFETNFGNDILDKHYSGIEILDFNGLNSTDFKFTRGKKSTYDNKVRDINNLYITEVATGSEITVKNFYSSSELFTFNFSDLSLTGIDVFNIYQKVVGTDDADIIYGTEDSDHLEGGAGNDALYAYSDKNNGYNYEYTTSTNTLDGGEGNDYLKGSKVNDTLIGGADNDTLDAGAGNDILIGGAGNDTLNGGEGTNTYKFETNFGNDIIENNYNSTEILEFGNLDIEAFEFTRGKTDTSGKLTNPNHLYIKEISTGATVEIQNFYYEMNDPMMGIVNNAEKFTFEFANETITGLDMKANNLALAGDDNSNIIYGTEGSDIVEGNGGNDSLFTYKEGRYSYNSESATSNNTLDGGAGNDNLYGGKGNDTLIGGEGDDYLTGKEGTNTYKFATNYGSDRLEIQSGSISIIEFDGLNLSDLEFRRGKISTSNNQLNNINSLYILENNTDSIIEINNFYNNQSIYDSVTVKFADGTTLTGSDIVEGFAILKGDNKSNLIYGSANSDIIDGGDGNDTLNAGEYGRNHYDTAENTLDGGVGNDTLNAGYGNDTLIGGEGNDILNGSRGDDIFEFADGFGSDIITDTVGSSTIKFTGSITLEDLDFSRGRVSDSLNSGYYNIEDLTTLLIKVKGTEDTIKVNSFFSNDYTTNQAYGANYTIEFSDGSTYTGQDIINNSSIIIGDERNNKVYGSSLGEEINGNEGNDWLQGDLGSDTINGGDGNDNIYGYKDRDLQNETVSNTLNGGSGNDYIVGAYGDDIINGGLDNDTLVGSNGNDIYEFYDDFGQDTILDTNGDLTIKFKGSATLNDLEFIRGTISDNLNSGYYNIESLNDLMIKVKGTTDYIKVLSFFSPNSSNDNIAYGSSYKIEFADGTIYTGQEILDNHAQITGDEKNNKVYGTSEDDIINGGDGNDWLQGSLGADTINGGNGNDSIYAYDNRYLQNETVSNTLNGGSGNDYIVGAYGDDIIIGGEGNDNLNGSQGNDIYEFSGNFGSDIISDVTGNDTIKFKDSITLADLEFSRGVISDYVNSGYNNLENTNDLFIKVKGTENSIRVSYFFSYNDHSASFSLEFADGTVYTGQEILDNYSNLLSGDERNNKVYGTSEDDIINGGDGNDWLQGSLGADTINGGNGNDSIYAYDNRYPQNDTSVNILNGNAGNDNIMGGYGDDIINGGEGNDSLNGYSGADTYEFLGDFGSDTINDNNGASTIKLDVNLADIEFVRGKVSDYIYQGRYELQNTNILFIKVLGTENIITVNNFFVNDIYGTGDFYGKTYTLEFADGTTLSGSDIITNYGSFEGNEQNNKITGDALDNIIKGNGGTDMLYGEAGADTIYGGEGNDTLFAGNQSSDTAENKLYGNEGNDVLYAAAGNDILDGGQGNDSLNGYAGDDTYIFDGDFDMDTIYDTQGTNTLVIDSEFDKLWFSKEGDTLHINKLETDERISIYSLASSTNKITTKDGFELDNTNFDSLINAMAQFNPQGGISETFNPVIDQQTTDLIAASWIKN